jgi:hypothetical protein
MERSENRMTDLAESSEEGYGPKRAIFANGGDDEDG